MIETATQTPTATPPQPAQAPQKPAAPPVPQSVLDTIWMAENVMKWEKSPVGFGLYVDPAKMGQRLIAGSEMFIAREKAGLDCPAWFVFDPLQNDDDAYAVMGKCAPRLQSFLMEKDADGVVISIQTKPGDKSVDFKAATARAAICAMAKALFS